jgi:hypothetical protein
MGMKLIAERFQLRPKFKMVIDFPVEDNHGVAIARSNGLIARSEIENLQSGCAQGAQAG